jgi:hypothetical protein
VKQSSELQGFALWWGRRFAFACQPIFHRFSVYRLLEAIPSTRESAARLGLVTRNEMVGALGCAVREPAVGTRIIGVREIRRLGKAATSPT